MAQIVALDAEPTAADVIATLEKALQQAREGDLSSVALAFVHRDGAVSCAWSELPSRPTMLGSISRLAHKLNVDLD